MNNEVLAAAKYDGEEVTHIDPITVNLCGLKTEITWIAGRLVIAQADDYGEYALTDTVFLPCTTRGQLRSLLAALGMKGAE